MINMTLNQLQTIDIIVKTGSFSAAAKQLNKAQSAVSYSIKQLEQEWGIEIFDRSSYRAKLTQPGQALLGKLRAVLSSVESLDRHSRSLSTDYEPRVRISINNLLPIDLLTPILYDFKKMFPLTQLQLAVEHMGAAGAKLEAGSTDLAITQFNPARVGLEYKNIYNVELIGVAAKQYIDSKADTTTDLLGKTQIVVSSHSAEDRDERGGMIEGANIWSVADHGTKRGMILRGLGFGYMPLYLIEKDLKNGKLKEIAIMKRVTVPMLLQRRVIDPMGPAKTFIWESVLSQR